MRKLLLLILVFLNQLCYSQDWNRIIGIPNRIEVFRNLNETYDGGYFVLGAYHFFPDTRGWIIKTDINGNILYDISLGSGSGNSQVNYPNYIEPTIDGGFIVCGSHDYWSLNDIGISKHNACGDLEWCKVFKTYNPDWGVEIKQLADGGYVLITFQYGGFPWNPKVHLFRLNSVGEVLWIEPYAMSTNHPNISENEPYDLVVTHDEDFFISGLCYWCDEPAGTGGINNKCRLKAMAIFADSSKQEEWVSIYKASDTLAYSLAGWSTQHENGSFYVGAVDQTIWPNSMPRLLKFDINGNLIGDSLVDIPLIDNKWAEGFMVNPSFTRDGRLFTYMRFVEQFNTFPGWFGLHELDSLGGWQNSIIHPIAHYPAGLIVTNDDKILAGAVVGSELNQDIILMKFNTSLEYDSIYTAPREYDYLCPDPIVSKTIDLSSCEVIVDVKDIPTRKEYEARISLIPITPAPNPASDYVRFLLQNTEYHTKIRVVCYDIQGRQLAELPVNSGIHETGLDVSRWRPGMYMAVVYAGNKQMGKTRFVIK